VVVLYWPKLKEPIALIFWSLAQIYGIFGYFLSLTGENQSELSEKLDVLRAEV